MTINHKNRRSRARTEPLPDALEPLDPECFVQQLSEVMGERNERQQFQALPTTPDKRRIAARRQKAKRDWDRRWWDDC